MNKIKTLIPLSEFVSKIDEICPLEIDQMYDLWKLHQLGLIIRYNNLLLQPLNIGMFVPADEDGNVLEQPYNDGEDDMYYNANKEYQQAKSLVLFEGFYVRNTELDGDDITKVVTNEKEYPFHFQDGKWKIGLGNKVVDDLLKSNVLTDQSLKQIYG